MGEARRSPRRGGRGWEVLAPGREMGGRAREVAAISPSAPRGPLVRVHCLEDSSPSPQSIQNTSDTFLSPQFFLSVCDTASLHASKRATLLSYLNSQIVIELLWTFSSKNCPLPTVATMDPDCQIALSENLKKFQPMSSSSNSSLPAPGVPSG